MVRFKNRWLLVEFIPARRNTLFPIVGYLDGKKIYTALRQNILSNFGDTGWGAVGLSLTVKYFSPTTNLCIIRVAREQHNLAWGALTMVIAVEGVNVIPNVIHVSGTIKHTQLIAIEHNRKIVARYRTLAKTPAPYQDSYDTYLKKSTLDIQALQD